ncbi:RNA methyltransferase, TrmH family [Oceanospirillum multiglobuliferum]|uniref:rRNA methyltransferase n=1 Tax=Oceanospirillum multiglobuliferum TaxID=64969 RepID=A0A1T4MAH6_9GAMM|nr:RNA methyltransferase [Oceanospirillum multiglobuliferum]OPX56183.1 rRNA methyltransferase [Oceanospirillum multiglobuliferum]SJZ63837.1 RNA methyltransferase, TrmH family [Oceanospirillum multiglobuliferum]
MKLDDVKKLHQKKYRTQFGHYLVEGEHLILELQKALKAKPYATPITLYVTETHQDWARQLDANFQQVVLSEKQMAQLSDTKTPQGIMARLPLPDLCHQPEALQQGERCIYLHEVQDPGNLGTIIRTLAWFGNFRLLLSPNSVDPFNSKVVRASMGAIFHLPIELDVPLTTLSQRFSQFAYLDLNGEVINASAFADYQCYLFGNEARGVPLEALSAFNAEAYTIAGCGRIDSLNLASSVGICAYQLSVSG